MSAVDRISATLAKHQRKGASYRCHCGWEWPEKPTWGYGEVELFERALAVHQAAVIASAADLAVISLPARAPSTVEYWEAPVQVHRDSFGIHMGALIRFPAADEAVRQAAALLAAVKAAEAVSDRGDN